MTIARNLAGVSTNALITYNYVVLEQNAERVSEEEDVAYVIIHDKEHRMAAFTGHGEKQGQLLTDLVSQKALSAREPYIQSITYGERKVPALDLSVPVYVEGSEEKWGTIRIGLSLERMASEILRTRLNLLFSACSPSDSEFWDQSSFRNGSPARSPNWSRPRFPPPRGTWNR